MFAAASNLIRIGKGPADQNDVPPAAAQRTKEHPDALRGVDIIITSQGGDYTAEIFPEAACRRLEGFAGLTRLNARRAMMP